MLFHYSRETTAILACSWHGRFARLAMADEEYEKTEIPSEFFNAPDLMPGQRVQTEQMAVVETKRAAVDSEDKGELKIKPRSAQVMFVGPVPGMPAGYWVGVQYDDKVGKNDGSINGRRYFRCPPGHGGFLRPNKIKKTIQGSDQVEEVPGLAGMSNQLSVKGGGSATDKKVSPGREAPADEAKTPVDAASAPNTYATGTGLSSAVVGSLAQFTIIAQDASSRRLEVGGDKFSVTMRGRGCTASQPALVRTKLIDRGDGTYMCEYRPWLTGTFSVSITLDSTHIGASPYTLNVINLRPDPANCIVRGDSLRRAVARMPHKFEIHFVDAMGHPAQAEELDVSRCRTAHKLSTEGRSPFLTLPV